MADLIGFFLLGIVVFIIGLTTGWKMRGSVKELDYQRFVSLNDKIDKYKWTLEDINKKVRK
jgi:hypothetical protein